MTIQEYYKNYDEENRFNSRYGITEFLTTINYIEKYTAPSAKIIEIGAGTGRYSRALAQKGYSVDAVELVQHNIDIFKSKISDEDGITVTQGNATNLSEFGSEKYDAALLLGPMYHLFTEEEQRRALSEAVRVTKRGGIIFIAYCMGDATLLTYGFVRGYLDEIMSDCGLDSNFKKFEKPWGIFQLYRVEDIEALRRMTDVDSICLVGADGYANHMRDALEKMDEDSFRLFLQYHLAVCERPELIGMSHHTIDILRKRN